ncbi:MAG: hypothetical protein ACYDGY_05760 [Acidimicrobiales bacterium]
MNGFTRLAKIALVVVVSEMVEVVLLQRIDIFGAHPSVMVLIPVLAGYIAGPSTGAAMGLVAGLTADLFLPTPFGLSALVWICAGYVAGYATVLLQDEAAPTGTLGQAGTLPVVFVCALFAGSALAGYALLGALFGVPPMLTYYLPQALPAVIVGAFLGAGPMMVAVRWALRRETVGKVPGMLAHGRRRVMQG